MRTIRTSAGPPMPVLGQGTWEMGVVAGRRRAEVEALRLGLDLGMTLVDTAEMYASGGAEEVVGEAMAGRRDEVFLVSKVLPANATREGTMQAAERSLRRLKTDRLELYLLHWVSEHPLEGTLEAFERLVAAGKILSYGVSNFDVGDMETALRLPGGGRIAANQVFYNLKRRGIERNLLPWCLRRGIVLMAYSPLDQGKLPGSAALRAVATRHGVTPACAALAWTLRLEGLVSIPKSSEARHVRENARAAEVTLTEEDLAELDGAFPPPARDVPLETV